MEESKRVCIFTTFTEAPEAYSLNRVVKNQLKMLLDHGYKPSVIVAGPFEPVGIYADERVTLKRIPVVPVHNEVKKDPSFDEDVAAIQSALKEALKDTDVVIAHDIVYQTAALKHNLAARRIADEFPKTKWLHWIHSATSPITLSNLKPHFEQEYTQLLTQPFPNSLYVYFNHWSIPKVAKEHSVSQDKVKVVHHPSDPAEVLGLTPDIAKLAREKGFYQADAICVYPIRLDRGKQVEMVIKIMASIKEFDLKVKVVIVDFHSTGGDKVTYRDELKSLAIDWGLNADEIIWTSETKEEWNAEIPHADVLSLMRLSNVFIMPSRSESYSLITQEAGMNKCVMVLNHDFPPFRDIFGPNAIYRKFSSNLDMLAEPSEAMGEGKFINTAYGPANISDEERVNYERKYHIETAGMIVAKLKGYQDLAMASFLRKFRNPDYVFKHELEPLLFEEIQ